MLTQNKRLNLDANATYGISPELLDYLSEVLPNLLNPSSIHIGGQKARALIEDTRDVLRSFIGADRRARVIFTSGASEANNFALLHGIFKSTSGNCDSSRHFLTSSLEHPSVQECFDLLIKHGWRGESLSPIGEKQIVITRFIEKLQSNTKLLSLMYANNETGDIFPVEDLFRKVKKENNSTLIHCDAVQALGKLELNFNTLGCDMMTLSGHKIGALPGVGALIVREDLEITPLIRGGAQERGLRAGTENIAGILSLSWIIERVKKEFQLRLQQMDESKKLILALLSQNIPELEINTNLSDALPNTINIRIPGILSGDLVVALDLKGIAISSGAACSSGKPEPSRVLLAMGNSIEMAMESVRISITHELKPEDAIYAVNIIVECIKLLRRSVVPTVNEKAIFNG